jgi:kynurenine formamidase
LRLQKEQIMNDRESLGAGRPTGPARQIDLSHTIEDGMVTYRGLPAPIVCDFLSREASRALYAEGTEFHIGKIELVANTGTYVDSPFHRFSDGKDLSELPLQSLADLEGVVVRAQDLEGRSIGRDVLASALAGADPSGKAVLVHTDWSRHWRTDRYFEGHPFITADAAAYLVEAGATLVGIDSYNIDDTDDGRRPAHTALLGAGIPIVEHMTGLEALPVTGFRFSAVPVKVKGMGTFPVRAYAVVGDG